MNGPIHFVVQNGRVGATFNEVAEAVHRVVHHREVQCGVAIVVLCVDVCIHIVSQWKKVRSTQRLSPPLTVIVVDDKFENVQSILCCCIVDCFETMQMLENNCTS